MSEFFDYRLYQDDLEFREKQAFLGRRGQKRLEEVATDELSRFLAYDKLTMYLLLRGVGLPVPTTLALYCEQARSCPFPVLRCPSDLADFLVDCADYPIYVKRSHGNFARGNTSLNGCSSGVLEFGGGKRMPVDDFVASLHDRSRLGWIIQKTLSPHLEIRARCGDKISGARFYTVLSTRGPLIHRAVWKINVGTKDSDNFEGGKSGNMLGAVDLASGTVTRAVAGLGTSHVEDPVHPVTGARLSGFVLPHWELAKSVVTRASAVFPGLIAQGWDVALCEEGPVLLEVNIANVNLAQLAHRKGFLDEAYLGYLEELGILDLFHGPSQPWRSVRGGARRGRRAQHWKWW